MTLDTFLFTFNCGKALQPIDILASAIESALPSTKQPDLLAFGFEELAPILDSSFEDVDLYVQSLLEAIGQALLSKYSVSYKKIAHSIIGAVGLIVFALDSITIERTSSATTTRGALYSSLKGAAGVRLTISKDSRSYEVTLVDAHLAANEGMVDKRNQDFSSIVRSLDFGDGYGAYKPGSHLFFLGDLNYRVSSVITDNSSSHQPLLDSLESALDRDELSRVISQGQAFYGFEEAPITFKPTYKFRVGISTNDAYDLKRTPSWCDRILYLAYGNSGSNSIEIHAYDSIPSITTSDHKPVYLFVSLPDTPPPSVLLSDGSLDSSIVATTNGINLSLKPVGIAEYAVGRIGDRTIGWSLYIATDPQGRSYSLYTVGSLLGLAFLYQLLF